MTGATMRGSPLRHCDAYKIIEVLVGEDDVVVSLIKDRGLGFPNLTAEKLDGALWQAARLLNE